MKRLTTEEVQKTIDASTTVHLEASNYINAKTKLTFRCKVCNTERLTEWRVIKTAIAAGNTGCPQCAKEAQTKTPEQYIIDLGTKSTDIIALEPYINAKTRIKHRCITCSNIWLAAPDKILNEGTGCPECSEIARRKTRTKTHEQYVEELKHKQPNIEVLGTYVNAKAKLKHKCKLCSSIWNPLPLSVVNHGTGCPECALVINLISYKGERTEELEEAAKNIPCSLYILDSAICIKVGISRIVVARIKSLNCEGFESILLEEYKLNAWDAIHLEQKLHKEFKRYKSSVRFNGHTELHYKEDLNGILEYITNSVTCITNNKAIA